jgi:hypothetical protein
MKDAGRGFSVESHAATGVPFEITRGRARRARFLSPAGAAAGGFRIGAGTGAAGRGGFAAASLAGLGGAGAALGRAAGFGAGFRACLAFEIAVDAAFFTEAAAERSFATALAGFAFEGFGLATLAGLALAGFAGFIGFFTAGFAGLDVRTEPGFAGRGPLDGRFAAALAAAAARFTPEAIFFPVPVRFATAFFPCALAIDGHPGDCP